MCPWSRETFPLRDIFPSPIRCSTQECRFLTLTVHASFKRVPRACTPYINSPELLIRRRYMRKSRCNNLVFTVNCVCLLQSSTAVRTKYVASGDVARTWWAQWRKGLGAAAIAASNPVIRLRRAPHHHRCVRVDKTDTAYVRRSRPLPGRRHLLGRKLNGRTNSWSSGV